MVQFFVLTLLLLISTISLFGDYFWAGGKQYKFFIICIFCFLAGLSVKDIGFVKSKLPSIFCVCGFLISGFAIFQHLIGLNPVSFVGNRNLAAQTTILIFPFLLYLLFTKKQTIICILLCIIFLLGISTAESLISWGILIASFLIFTSIVVPKNLRGFLTFWTVIGAIFLLALLIPASDILIKALFANIRLMIWSATVDMIFANPIFGFGIGRFLIYYQNFRLREYFLHPFAAGVTEYAHNEFLQVGAEIGLIGFLLFISFIVLSIPPSVKNIFKKTGDEKFFLTSIISSIAAGVLIGLFEQWLRFMPVALFFYFLMGVSYSINDYKRGFVLPSKIISVVCLVLFLMSTPHIVSQFFLHKADVLSRKHQFGPAIENFEKALEFDRYNITAQYFLACQYLNVGLWNEAIEELKRTEEIWPDYGITNVLLGAALLNVGRVEDAKKALNRAEYINPYDPDMLALQADIARMEGNIALEQAYRRKIDVLKSMPGLPDNVRRRLIYQTPLR
jgi:O-antigen ligase/Tfp pilus assembly protein PilF